jgi:hypothetical protein
MTERSTAAVSDSSCTYNNKNTIVPKWFNTTVTENPPPNNSDHRNTGLGFLVGVFDQSIRSALGTYLIKASAASIF